MICEVLTWIKLNQNTVQWGVPVNMIMNLRVLSKAENSLTCWQCVSFSNGFWPMELVISLLWIQVSTQSKQF